MTPTIAPLTAALALGLCSSAGAAEVVRTYANPKAIIAQTITVPAGYETVYFSGLLPDMPPAPAVPGDAEAQAASVFAKIGALLRREGLTEADVVSMTIYMAGGPDGARMDFAGMMRAYSKVYGTAEQPNRPTRSTVQVANLAAPGALLEVEVTAVRRPR